MSKTPQKTPETIDELIRWSAEFLANKGFSSARLDTELLLAHVLGLRRIDLYLRFDQPLSRQELASFKAVLVRRMNHEPVAYILGHREFMGLRFEVDSRVLIPRSETELLVERILEFGRSRGALRILEIGVGSGCIGLSLLHFLPDSSLVALDVSPDAIAVSKSNARNISVDESRFTFLLKDALDENNWKGLGKFDIIVSNPPYITTKERSELAPSVVNFEPELALFGGEDGLKFYQCLAVVARECLLAGGRMFLEIGRDQGRAVSELLRSQGWSDVEVRKDYSKHDRIVEGAYESEDAKSSQG